MARGGSRPGTGGFRVGAGRKKRDDGTPPDIAAGAENADMTPLDYMLAVMRDATAAVERRDRMAQAAAPFVHVRADAVAAGKKEQAAAAAQEAAATGSRFAPPLPPKLVVDNRG